MTAADCSATDHSTLGSFALLDRPNRRVRRTRASDAEDRCRAVGSASIDADVMSSPQARVASDRGNGRSRPEARGAQRAAHGSRVRGGPRGRHDV